MKHYFDLTYELIYKLLHVWRLTSKTPYPFMENP